MRARTALFTAILATIPAWAGGPHGQEPEARVVNIVAERFSFTPSEIRVEQGTLLEIRLTSDDTSHGFKLTAPDGVDVEIPKRGRGDVRIRFRAETPGRYAFECSRLCGAGHSFMRGSIRVDEKKR